MNKNFLVLTATLLFIFSSCTPNNTKVDNSLKKYFDSSNVDGSFEMLNNQMGEITLYNMKLDTQRISPASTFNVFCSLVGVQSGIIANENMTLEAIGDTTADSSMTIKEAFQNSYNPYFQALAHRIGRDSLQLWIDSIGYGNKNTAGAIDSFWINNHLQISPDEQLGFMSKLYFEQLPFQKYAQQLVSDLMLREDNTLYRLSYTTGAGIDESGESFGWVTGWIEENRHIYFFVTLIKSKDKARDMNKTGIEVSKKILKHLGFFKGLK